MSSAWILNLGSLNIDRVFRVEQIARPGETIASQSLAEFAGGKGANQSVALARAGATVAHLGKVGPDGRWLVDRLAREDIDTSRIGMADEPTGQAIIQVDARGENGLPRPHLLYALHRLGHDSSLFFLVKTLDCDRISRMFDRPQ